MKYYSEHIYLNAYMEMDPTLGMPIKIPNYAWPYMIIRILLVRNDIHDNGLSLFVASYLTIHSIIMSDGVYLQDISDGQGPVWVRHLIVWKGHLCD